MWSQKLRMSNWFQAIWSSVAAYIRRCIAQRADDRTGQAGNCLRVDQYENKKPIDTSVNQKFDTCRCVDSTSRNNSISALDVKLLSFTFPWRQECWKMRWGAAASRLFRFHNPCT